MPKLQLKELWHDGVPKTNDGTDLNVLMRHADEAMYNAKAAGRNNFQIYEAKNR